MEQLIADIKAYTSAQQVTPQKFLRDVIGASWNTWSKWQSSESTPTMAVVDRIRAHMAAHPPKKKEGAA